jgi:uncharacterized membrane protein YhhN
MRRAVALIAALSLAACGGYTTNHQRGLIFVGGATAFVGTIITLDGAYCDESTTRAGDCEGDDADLAAGVVTLLVGAGLLAVGLLLQPK